MTFVITSRFKVVEARNLDTNLQRQVGSCLHLFVTPIASNLNNATKVLRENILESRATKLSTVVFFLLFFFSHAILPKLKRRGIEKLARCVWTRVHFHTISNTAAARRGRGCAPALS